MQWGLVFRSQHKLVMKLIFSILMKERDSNNAIAYTVVTKILKNGQQRFIRLTKLQEKFAEYKQRRHQIGEVFRNYETHKKEQ